MKIVSCQGTKQSTQSEIILPREGHICILENPKHFCKSWLQEKDSTWSFLLVRNSVVANIWSFDASSFQLAKPERSKLQFRAFAKRVDVPFAGNLLISLKWLFLKTISAIIPKSFSATCIDTALKKHVCPPFKPENSKHFWPAPYFQAHPKGFHRAIVALELPLGWISSETQVFFKLKIYLIATVTSCHVSFCEIWTNLFSERDLW